MLDVGSRQEDIARWICSLPCHVQLPQKLREEMEKTGAVPVPGDDVRRHRRVLLPGRKAPRGARTQAEPARAAPGNRLAKRLYQRLLPARLQLPAQRDPLSGRKAAADPADGRRADDRSGLVPATRQELLRDRRAIHRDANRPAKEE